MNRNARLLGAAMALPCAAVLATAAWLTPSDSGMETHRQLGLPSCGFYGATGYPCPSCGMTTSFTHAAHGHLLESFVTQPAGFILCILCSMLFLIGAWSVATGMHGAHLAGRVFSQKKTLWTLGAILLLGWGWTIGLHTIHH